MGFHDIHLSSDQEAKQDFSQGKLTFAWLEVTQHCNLRCMHCYTTSSPARNHGSIDWNSVIRQIYDTGCRHIQFIGGEPLTHPHIREYIKLAYELDFEFIEVFTNAALLDEDTAQFLAKFGVNVATSFYSTQATSHEATTLTKGSFDQTLSGIRNALASGLKLRVGVIDAAGDGEPFEEKSAFLEVMGVDRKSIGYDAVRPVGRGAKINEYVSRSETLCGACWNGKLVVSYDGNCYPCIMSRDVVVGNISKQTVGEVIAARALNEFRAAYGAEVLNARAKHRTEQSLTMGGDRDGGSGELVTSACTPDCGPAGPCEPSGCTPSGDCTPYHCSPVQPNCGPNDSVCNPGDCLPNLCNPYNVCGPYK